VVRACGIQCSGSIGNHGPSKNIPGIKHGDNMMENGSTSAVASVAGMLLLVKMQVVVMKEMVE